MMGVLVAHATRHGAAADFAALEPGRQPIGLPERLMAWIPMGKDGLSMGDVRERADIEAQAHGTAHDLQAAPTMEATR
jgi:hypothetical protein